MTIDDRELSLLLSKMAFIKALDDHPKVAAVVEQHLSVGEFVEFIETGLCYFMTIDKEMLDEQSMKFNVTEPYILKDLIDMGAWTPPSDHNNNNEKEV
jgi:hypothetical protein